MQSHGTEFPDRPLARVRLRYPKICEIPYICAGPTRHHYYRPPNQDGPSANSHNTDVPSLAIMIVFDRNALRRFALAALESKKGFKIELVLSVVLNEPINGDAGM